MIRSNGSRPLIIRPVIRPTTESEKRAGGGKYFFGFSASMTLEKAQSLIFKFFSRFRKK